MDHIQTLKAILELRGPRMFAEERAALEYAIGFVEGHPLNMVRPTEAQTPPSQSAFVASGSPRVNASGTLLAWLLETKASRVYSSKAMQLGPSVIRDRVCFMAAAFSLERQGHLRRLPVGTKIDGRHRKYAWEVIGAASRITAGQPLQPQSAH